MVGAGREAGGNEKTCRVWVQRAGAFGHGSGCLSPSAPNLLPPIQNPSAPKCWQLPQLPVMVVRVCQLQWGGLRFSPTQRASSWGSCLRSPLPKGKVTFGCSQRRVWLCRQPQGQILLASPRPCATVVQLDPSTHQKALACTAVVVLALGPWWDQRSCGDRGEAGAVFHRQGRCWRLAGARQGLGAITLTHLSAAGWASLAPMVGQGSSEDGL